MTAGADRMEAKGQGALALADKIVDAADRYAAYCKTSLHLQEHQHNNPEWRAVEVAVQAYRQAREAGA